MNRTVPPDWRIVKVSQTKFINAAYREEKQIAEAGVYFLVDANLRVHICSLTPSLEAFPVQAFAEFACMEAAEKDEGETERMLLNEEEPCSYYDTNMLRNEHRPLSDFMTLPEREDGETVAAFSLRLADDVRDHLAGNPVSF